MSKKIFDLSGFTLVESLVAVALFTLALGAIAGLVVFGYRTHQFAWQQARAIDEARRGIETMVKEIREAQRGEDGSFPIEKAGDKEFIFYSDVDRDGEVERVRYFLGSAGSGEKEKECVSFMDGGSCGVSFNNFLSGDLQEAEVQVSVEGDFGGSGWWLAEYADIYAEGNHLGRICEKGCSDCAGKWEGTQVFDVKEWAEDGSVDFEAEASPMVNDFCDWQDPNHSMKAKFDFSWTENISDLSHQFKKGIVDPAGDPPSYPLDQEETTILSSYVRNTPPIFKYYYFDSEQDKFVELTDYPARLKDTELMRVYLEVNVDPQRLPYPFELESSVQIRNLKPE